MEGLEGGICLNLAVLDIDADCPYEEVGTRRSPSAEDLVGGMMMEDMMTVAVGHDREERSIHKVNHRRPVSEGRQAEAREAEGAAQLLVAERVSSPPH